VEKAYARARDLALEVDDPQRLSQSLRGLWFVHNTRDHLKVGREVGKQLFDLAQKTRDSSFLLEAHSVLGTTLTYMGELESACSHLEAGIEMYDPARHRAHATLYAVDPGVYCRRMLAWPLWLRGYPDRALTQARDAIALGRELGHPFSLAYALAWGASLHAFRGEVDRALQLLEALKSLSAEHAFPMFAAWAETMKGWARVEIGQGGEGLTQMRSGLNQWEAAGMQVLQSHWLALLADACCKLARTEEGLSEIVEACAKAQKVGEVFWEAEIHRVEGELRVARGELGSAEVCFREALAAARRQGARALELRAASSAARLLGDLGRKEEARRLLRPVYGSFTEGFDTRELTHAASLLAELE
jgi:predicted ATPase